MSHREALQSLYSGQRYEEALALYERQMAVSDPEWHLLGSLCASRRTEWFAARSAIERALALPAEGDLLVKIRFQHGFVVRAIGDFALAIEEFDWCLSELVNIPSLRNLLTGPLWYNKALALGSTSNTTGSLQAYERAAAEFRREGLYEYLRMTLQNLAWVACLVGDVPEAAAALDEAAPLCTSETALWHQRLQLAHLARARGEQSEALRLCEWIEQFGHSGIVSADVLSLCACLTADIALDLGILDLAGPTLDLAYARALSSPSDSRCLAIVAQVRSRHQTLSAARTTSGA